MDAADGAVLDSWAWIEVLRGSREGERLHADYVEPRRAVTSAMAVAEVCAVLHREQGIAAADAFVRAVRLRGRVAPVDDEVAALAGQLVGALKATDRNASLADAVMLATARTLGLPLVSRDPAFKGCPDVRPG